MPEKINSNFVVNNTVKNISEFPGSFQPDDIILYEVVRLINGKILFLNDHLERFFASYHHINKTPGVTKENILTQLHLLIHANDISNGNIKFQSVIHFQSGDTKIYAFFIPHSYPTEKQYQEGVPVSMVTASRTNPNAKIQQTKLRNELNQLIKDKNIYEAILIHPDGYVTEGSRSNLFMIKNNTIFTSLESDILPGITMKYIIQLCNDIDLPICFQRITPEEMLSMQALFITGTSPKVLPVRSVSEHYFDVNHPILRKVMKKFDQVLGKNLECSINFFECL
jgi:branched-chain amino acid aminotransferase